MARVIIEHRGKRYRPYIVKHGMCTGKRMCALYDQELCDGPDCDHMPCIPLFGAIDRAGLQNAYQINFKDVKNEIARLKAALKPVMNIRAEAILKEKVDATELLASVILEAQRVMREGESK